MAARRDGQSDRWEHVALFSGVGFVLCGCIAAGIVFGWYIDKKLGSAPVATIIGSCFGLVAGLYEFFQILKRQEAHHRESDAPPEN